MRRWHKNIHIALTRSGYRELALHPVLDAIRLYKKTAKSTINGMIAASFIFIALLLLPLFSTQQNVLLPMIKTGNHNHYLVLILKSQLSKLAQPRERT